ncbi:flavin reductase family protein [Pseudolysinimonas kribbensis]|jgi:flavin reductase (DIM6/NTAB) family NADH-FMN oxidoreductase RutF|uniref:Flavin-dependent reductase n=1 Tax=Pseudolysinimonas kribbensis TaxID=433641 RepID=A0ABQ6JYF6_9MICO|nr:flavin reductase family protein [Pseudolysinimonas kribbensis]GMA93358.1 flavin-dependent reductase [Pseudolysinimonas kribbensis]
MQDQEAFRLAFRRLAAGVSVVTALGPDGAPVGFTATSLASLAADPPMATFNMARAASSWHAVEQTEHVLVHIMGARNRAAAHTMSLDAQLRFRGPHWAPGPLGIPQLRDVPAWMLGRVIGRYPVEESAVVVVRIEDGGLGEPDQPLLYHERDYWRPGDRID